MTLEEFLLDVQSKADAAFHLMLRQHPLDQGCVLGCQTCKVMAILANISTNARRWVCGQEPVGPSLDVILQEGKVPHANSRRNHCRRADPFSDNP